MGLEEIRKNRNSTMEDTDIKNEVLKEPELVRVIGHDQKDSKQESTEEVDDNLSQALLLNISESIAPEDVASKSFNLALALTADGLEEAAAFTVKDVVDEEFELKKRMIEEELRKIDESYNCNDNEGILAKKIIGAAESIQELAHLFGNEEVDLSSNINSLKKIKSEREEKTSQQSKSQINSTINAVPKIKFKDEG